jgi:hypothetical protein
MRPWINSRRFNVRFSVDKGITERCSLRGLPPNYHSTALPHSSNAATSGVQYPLPKIVTSPVSQVGTSFPIRNLARCCLKYLSLFSLRLRQRVCLFSALNIYCHIMKSEWRMLWFTSCVFLHLQHRLSCMKIFMVFFSPPRNKVWTTWRKPVTLTGLELQTFCHPSRSQSLYRLRCLGELVESLRLFA